MQANVTGRVYDVRSGDALSGVLVSNGEDVVRTDSAGRYRLSVEAEAQRFVFVTVPSGCRPVGSFFRRAAELAGAGDASGTDFALQAAPERSREAFTVLHVTDTHVVTSEDLHVAALLPPLPAGSSETEAQRWKKLHLTDKDLPDAEALAADLRQAIDAAAPDFVLATGDLTNAGTLGQLECYRDAIRSVDIPVFSVFGGHDGNTERASCPPDSGFTRSYERVLGPVWYSFDWGGWHVVVYAVFPLLLLTQPPLRMLRVSVGDFDSKTSTRMEHPRDCFALPPTRLPSRTARPVEAPTRRFASAPELARASIANSS